MRHQEQNPIPRLTRERSKLWVLVNAAALLPALYGIKCLATLRGQILVDDPYFVGRSFALAPAEGAAALFGGFAYIALGLFVWLSTNQPGSQCPFHWRFTLGVIRWGSLALMVWLFSRAETVSMDIPF